MVESMSTNNNLRLIEAGFPCHQVGAETQRERGASSALPPLYFLHVWWARRPLTPSRAAVVASLLPADTDPDWFLRQLGIEKVQAMVNGVPWVLTGSIHKSIKIEKNKKEYLLVDKAIYRLLIKEYERRNRNTNYINEIKETDLVKHPVITKWISDLQQFPEPLPNIGESLPVERVSADPALVKQRIEFRKSDQVNKIMNGEFKWDTEDLYGYDRAFTHHPSMSEKPYVVLDPTAGGGSIPFEALRLGHEVIANEINPVALTVLHATLSYPVLYGQELINDIKVWADKLLKYLNVKNADLFPNHAALPEEEQRKLKLELGRNIHLFDKLNYEDILDYIYVRQVTCPHCKGEAPLLNSSWLSKEGEQWGVRLLPDGRKQGGTVSFETYRMKKGRGPNGEDPNLSTVSNGVGTCVHCKQAIPADEIKAQARGESPYSQWQDRLYCVVAVRYQPKVDDNGKPLVYKSGVQKGEIKTKKIRFFRPPNERDLKALQEAEKRLSEKWDEWEKQGLIPTEKIPVGHKTMEPLRVGMNRWCDLFTPRQLLGHLYLVEELNRLKPLILEELGDERGRAVVTYLQFMIDKGIDYNSRQTRWIPQRGIVSGTFGRHDFSVKWTFGEMIFNGPNSGAKWGLSQIIDAYKGLTELMLPLHNKLNGAPPPLRLLYGTAAHMDIPDSSVDLICIDPPYYNNVQYAELSDFYYVWQKRTLSDLYPIYMQRRFTNKRDEAVANPARDGSAVNAAAEYQKLMAEIFSECLRVLKEDGVMTIMFTHKSEEAWTALTQSLIDNHWVITSSFPVESEFAHSQHIMNMASAASSVFITCRKREKTESENIAVWKGLGRTGVANLVRKAVRQGLEDFKKLNLNPVDEMVAAYGRALWILSEHWPVLDGDQYVSPSRAMLEASAVVAQYQIMKMTGGRLRVEDLNPEAAAMLTFYGIFNLRQFAYDQGLNLSRSLNLKLEAKTAGYRVEGSMVGINNTQRERHSRKANYEQIKYHAPLIRTGSKLRIALPEERHENRLMDPQTEWDILQGIIIAYRQGDAPLARDYMMRHAKGREQVIYDLLSVWVIETADDKLRKEGEALQFSLC